MSSLASKESAADSTVNRSTKGDQLAAPRPAEKQHTITAVEVIGVGNATIIYRDRAGNELFRTDPVSNVTVIAKDVVLPEVTIRERPQIEPSPMTLEEPHGANIEELEGCDPVASPLAGASLANRLGRCLAATESGTRMAMLNR